MSAMRFFILMFLTFFVFYGSAAAQEIGWNASGKGGAVAAGKVEAVSAGISILKQGGNAADAAVATLLALSITDYGLFCIGGEVPFLIYDAKKKSVKVLSGQGCAPLDPKAIEWYYENGIPSKGGAKQATVPGAVSLLFKTLQLYGTMSFEKTAQPSLTLLDAGGRDWYPNLAVTLRKLIQTERSTSGSRLKKLQAARDRFYKGDIADEMEAFFIQKEGFLRKADFAAYETLIEDPVTVNYRGYTVCKCDTWTQGPFLCQTLRLLEGFDLAKMGHLSVDYIHVMTEAMKLGFADRDMYYGDPRFVKVPMKALLSDHYTSLRRPLIDMTRASTEVRPGDPVALKALKAGGVYSPWEGGTTTCTIIDRWGNMVSATPSANRPYAHCDTLGVSFGTRLSSLNTTPGHPNRIEPGKRPRITLTPTIVLRNGKGILAISVAGGDFQDQTTLNCFLNFAEFHMMPEKAVTAPRFNTGHHEDSFNPGADRPKTYVKLETVTVNEGIGESVRTELTARGHKIEVSRGAIANPIMIYRDSQTGILYAAGDPRAGRHAAALK
ncbi:MAG: gamma-glutamyltransferase family protein [Candidatus Latescibacterota bacterium]